MKNILLVEVKKAIEAVDGYILSNPVKRKEKEQRKKEKEQRKKLKKDVENVVVNFYLYQLILYDFN